ncbi:hypothetical protein XF35_21210 [Streptomyces platensis subsp. clarensis]|nr:hypothetical protein [Streptomyces platensis subsp. clarensis]
MPGNNGEDPFNDLEDRFRREDARFARAMEHSRPCHPREYRRGPAWLLLAAALALLGSGIAIGNGLLIAAGLVGIAAAVHRFAPRSHRHGRCGPPPA